MSTAKLNNASVVCLATLGVLLAFHFVLRAFFGQGFGHGLLLTQVHVLPFLVLYLLLSPLEKKGHLAPFPNRIVPGCQIAAASLLTLLLAVAGKDFFPELVLNFTVIHFGFVFIATLTPLAFIPKESLVAVTKHLTSHWMDVFLGCFGTVLGGFANLLVWKILMMPTGILVQQHLWLAQIPVALERNPSMIKVSHPDLFINIHAPCGGMGGVFLFLTIFSIYRLARNENWTGLQLFLSYFLGVGLMLWVNVIRISALMGGGVVLTRYLGRKDAIEWTVGGFHSHLGSAIYAPTALFFVLFITPRLKTRRTLDSTARP